MGIKCIVKDCISEWRPACDVIFHKFPSDVTERNKWLAIVPLRRAFSENAKICSLHFQDSDYDRSGKKLLIGVTPFYQERNEQMAMNTDEPETASIIHDTMFYMPSPPQKVNNQSTSAIKFGADKNIQACLKTSREDSFEKENKLLAQKVVRLHKSQDSVEIKNDVKVFCPMCGTDISHTAQAIQEEQTKIDIAKMYHYFEQEYEELKTIYRDLDLTPLSNFCQRTARATGVSETTVVQILNEEKARNAEKLLETNLSRARKRSMRTESLCEEDDSDDIADPDENSIHFNGAETLLVKVEPEDYDNDEPGTYLPAAVKQELCDSEVITEQPLIDPIPLNMQTGPESDVFDHVEQAELEGKRHLNKLQQRRFRERQNFESSSTASHQADRSGLLEEAEVKVEEIEIEEEGFS